jgi:hypothetical protein
MAVLSGTTLTGCNYIPDFIASGTIMLFENTSSPTSWTKITTFNDTTCRVVSGSISNGGSTAFSSIFTTRTASGTINSGTASISWGSAASSVSINQATAPSLSVTPAIFYPSSHTHTFSNNQSTQRGGGPVLGYQASPATLTAPSIGLNQPHTHGASYSAQSHSHPASASSHTHPSLSWPHSHPGGISVSQNFNLYYVDVILASKD